MKYALLVLLMVSCVLSACSSLPMVSDVDVDMHQDKGSLLDFYERLNSELKLVKPKSDEAENRRQYIAITGEKIAENKVQIILNNLDRQLDTHSIAVLDHALSQSADIEEYSQKVYNDLKAQFEQAISQKKGIVLAKEAEYAELSDDDALKKVALLESIAAIYGEGLSADQALSQKTVYITSLYANADVAMTEKNYKKANMLVDYLDVLSPGYPGVSDIRQKLLAAEYEEQLWDALGKSQTDRAYATFFKLMQIPSYIETHPDIVPIADDMVQFFIAEGDQSMQAKAIDAAYQSYSRVRFIRNAIGAADEYSVGEKKFIESIEKRFTAYLDNSQAVPAFGHLLILQELMPNHGAVLKNMQTLEEAVLSAATIKILVMSFTNATQYDDLGSQIISKIKEALMHSKSQLVTVIDEHEVATNFSPSQIVSMPNPSSYYVLSGELLNAKLKTHSEQTLESKQVLIAYEKVVNPEYQQWSELSKRKRKELVEPESSIDKPVIKDIQMIKNTDEQKSMLSVAYRLAEAVSSSVVFSDTLVKEESFLAVNMPAVREGFFVQEEQKVALKTDEELLDELMQSIASDAYHKIVDQVKLLEDDYLKKADNALVLEDFNLAAANYAYGFMLKIAEEQPDEDALKKLKTYSLRWR